MSFIGRHVLVTGGGRGIGRAVARAFAASGATVTVTGRNAARLDETLAVGDAHHASAFDLTDEPAARHALNAIVAARPVDILVANAGGVETAPFHRTDAAMFRRMFELNVVSVSHAVHSALPAMRARRFGRIITIASIAGLKGAAYVSAYVAAKHAVVGLVRALAIETAREGITVNALCPGYVETDIVSGSLDRIHDKTGKSRDEALAAMLKDNPQGRLIRPEEVAAACLWLASDAAGAVTGAAIPIAGGEI
ncbi:MAG: SDR family NAD(P)-dependent oxidoreductase [Beijerinckiaceae bacterium]